MPGETETIEISLEATFLAESENRARLGGYVDLGVIRMTERKEKPRRERHRGEDSQIIGFRLPVPMAQAIKVEAARRQVPLNGLLAEMWQLYCENKRAG